jgi:hypothetical protein
MTSSDMTGGDLPSFSPDDDDPTMTPAEQAKATQSIMRLAYIELDRICTASVSPTDPANPDPDAYNAAIDHLRHGIGILRAAAVASPAAAELVEVVDRACQQFSDAQVKLYESGWDGLPDDEPAETQPVKGNAR